jgi:hypothetical protein
LRGPEAEMTASAKGPHHPVCGPERRFTNRAGCSKERASASGAWPLSAFKEAEVRQQSSAHPLHGPTGQRPAASSHSAGSSEQIAVLR